jgi:hypothetical protein
VRSGGRISTGEFLTYFCCISLLSVLSHLQFVSVFRKSIRMKWSNGTVKALTSRPIDDQTVYVSGGEKAHGW